MAFSNEQIIKLAGNVLAAGVIDSSGSNWYEQRNPNNFIIDPETVWSDLPLMKDYHAANWAEVVANVNAAPEYFGFIGVNPDGTYDDTSAIRLTPVAGTNNASYIAYNEYNNPASGVQRSWIQPQLLPRPNGAASAAYQATIWSGPPSNGNRILTSTGNDGNWVSHFWNAAGGLLLISPNDAPPSASFPSTDLYVTGVVYTGATGGGGGFSGSSILLQDPEGQWRITASDWPVLRFERREYDDNGLPVWNTQAAMGASVTTDGITLTRPFNIDVDLSANNLNDSLDGSAQDLKSVFRVSGTDADFIYGNSEQQTVLETKRGTEVKRYDAVREEQEIENRPLADMEVILDTTDAPVAGSFTELSWVSNINYSADADFIRFNTLGFEVLEVEDDPLSTETCPIRIAVEKIDGELIQENVSKVSLDSGMSGGFDLRVGFHHYNIQPKYTDRRDAQTVTRIQLSKGHRIKLTGGMYTATYTDENGVEQTVNQFVPRQKAKVEFLNDVNVWDGSNWKREMYNDSRVFIDGGSVGSWYPEETGSIATPFAKVSEHTTSDEVVLGNYNDKSYVATGSGGLFVLYEDNTTLRSFWTEGDKERLNLSLAPTFYKEVTEVELDLNGVFVSEMDELGWDVVNVQSFSPLIRNENAEEIGYRMVISSTIEEDVLFQESQSKFEFLDGVVNSPFSIKPTIDAFEPEYVKLSLPRNKFTVNRETPRKITIQFQRPVKLYGFYKDPTDPADITTGTFVPSFKAEVLRIFEEEVVSGSSLEDRLDSVQGEIEWNKAVEGALPTVHEVPSLLVWATEDDEWIFWSDQDALYSDQDEQQWIFTEAGTEAYFELTDAQGTWSQGNSVFTFNECVVNIPYERTNSFDVSFGWHSSFNDNGALKYGVFTFYLNSHGRLQDSKVSINVPVNASITWRFRKRRTGNFSFYATPMNDNLASTQIVGGDLQTTIPVDEDPPILVGGDI